jgi:hypothetical protein
VFCGDEYVTIKVIPGTTSDTTARGSRRFIFNDWPSLFRTEFAHVDRRRVTHSEQQQSNVFFFSSESYALINTDFGS